MKKSKKCEQSPPPFFLQRKSYAKQWFSVKKSIKRMGLKMKQKKFTDAVENTVLISIFFIQSLLSSMDISKRMNEHFGNYHHHM